MIRGISANRGSLIQKSSNEVRNESEIILRTIGQSQKFAQINECNRKYSQAHAGHMIRRFVIFGFLNFNNNALQIHIIQTSMNAVVKNDH